MLVNGALWPRRRGTGRYLPHTGYPRGLAPWMAQNEWTRIYSRHFAARRYARQAVSDFLCGVFWASCSVIALEIAWLFLARM